MKTVGKAWNPLIYMEVRFTNRADKPDGANLFSKNGFLILRDG